MPRPTARTTQTAALTVEALSHKYAVKFPLVTMVRSKFAPKSTLFRGSIAKPLYLLHPCTCPTYGAKGLPDAICHFPQCTGQRDRRTDRPTYRSRESLMTIGRCAPRATRPNNNNIHICISPYCHDFTNCYDPDLRHELLE